MIEWPDYVWEHAPYSLVYADPPWPCRTVPRTGRAMTDSTGRKRSWMGYATDPYRTMRADEILAMRVSDIAARDGLLILWVPWVHLPLGVRALEAWGYGYSTGCPWLKVTKNGSPHFGVGMWFQHCTEVLLIGRRGHLSWDGHTHPSPARVGLFITRRGKHSEKPEEVAKWAKGLLPGPRIELFARKRRPGWVCWGDQLPPLRGAR